MYYIKERHNPQFDKPYYILCGKLTKKEASKKEQSLYGHNIMIGFKTKKEYDNEINKLEFEKANISRF